MGNAAARLAGWPRQRDEAARLVAHAADECAAARRLRLDAAEMVDYARVLRARALRQLRELPRAGG